MVIAPLIAGVLHTVFGILMFIVSLFLIMLVLVQRGRGGGLSGAFGGMGGQSAFGTRAGDTFTYITIWASAGWILLCIAGVKLLGFQAGKLGAEEPPAATQPAGSDQATEQSDQGSDGGLTGTSGPPADSATSGQPGADGPPPESVSPAAPSTPDDGSGSPDAASHDDG